MRRIKLLFTIALTLLLKSARLVLCQPLIDAFKSVVGPYAEGVIAGISIIFWLLVVYTAIIAFKSVGEMRFSGMFRGMAIFELLSTFKWPIIMALIPLAFLIMGEISDAYANSLTGAEHDIAIGVANTCRGIATILTYPFSKISDLLTIFGGTAPSPGGG